MKIKEIIERSLILAIRVWTTPVLQFGVRGNKFNFKLFPNRIEISGIDERIAQIDTARQNLMAALTAVDELKVTAQKNQEELKSALERLQQIHNDKTAAEKELRNVKHIAQADIEVFKRLAGVPSRRDIARERFIGFIIGVVASLVASLIFWYFMARTPPPHTSNSPQHGLITPSQLDLYCNFLTLPAPGAKKCDI